MSSPVSKRPEGDRQWIARAVAHLQSITPPRPERPRSVYVLKVGEMFKIGLSVDPEKRIKSLQTSKRRDWLRSYEVPFAPELERALHKRFKDKREYGEWFLLNADDLKRIERIARHWKRVRHPKKYRTIARVIPINRKGEK